MHFLYDNWLVPLYVADDDLAAKGHVSAIEDDNDEVRR